MAYELSTVSAQRRSRGQVIAERLDLHTALVSLGAGALGATILAIASGGITVARGGLAVQNHDALILACVVGLIEAVLTVLFKTDAFAVDGDEPTPHPLYLENLRLSAPPSPSIPVHFRSWETEHLKQIARARDARAW